MFLRKLLSLSILFWSILCFSQQGKNTADYDRLILRLDTLSKDKRSVAIKKIISSFSDKNDPYYNYFKARYFSSNQNDSCQYYLSKIDTKIGQLYHLKKLLQYNQITSGRRSYNSTIQNNLLNDLKSAERGNSPFRYDYYDLIAAGYYRMQDEKNALKYVQSYHDSHPYKNARVIRLHYNEAMRLLHSGNADETKKNYQLSAHLVREIDNDTVTFDINPINNKGMDINSLTSQPKGDVLSSINYTNKVIQQLSANNPDSAAYYHKELSEISKTTSQPQPSLNIANDTKTLDSEKNQENKSILQNRWFLGIIILCVISLLSYIIYRQYVKKRQTEKNKEVVTENPQSQLEQKILQLQLNPHFIYNSIANLQSLIRQEKNETSIDYLNKFSKHLREVLELNREDYITISEEVKALENYLQLQQIRFENAFQYRIIVDKDLAVDEVLIPPMLLQPFIENCIEHGFKSIDYTGSIIIDFQKIYDTLLILIRDNGNSTKEEEKVAKKSLSTQIINDRLETIFKDKNYFLKQQNTEEGYIVTIGIPLIT